MRHNKIIGWENFLDVIEKVQRVSPWLSRQMSKRAADWPFWASGVQVEEWRDRQAWVKLPHSFLNVVDGEICSGHLMLASELALRLVLLKLKQEFPFRYRLRASGLETHHRVDQAVDVKFEIAFAEWERMRLELARHSTTDGEFVFPARLADGRLAATFTFHLSFELEKLLPA